MTRGSLVAWRLALPCCRARSSVGQPPCLKHAACLPPASSPPPALACTATASVECGRADWKEHKKACKLLGAERERRREARREAGDEAAA